MRMQKARWRMPCSSLPHAVYKGMPVWRAAGWLFLHFTVSKGQVLQRAVGDGDQLLAWA